MGDSIGAGIVQHLSRNELMKFDDPESPDNSYEPHTTPGFELRQV